MVQGFYKSMSKLSKRGFAVRRSLPRWLLLLASVFAMPALAEPDAERPPFITSIEFDGNESLSSGELKSVMRTREPRLLQFFSRPRYARDWLRSDLALLEAYYHRAGFYDARVSSLREGDLVFDDEIYGVKIKIHVEEGKRRYARNLAFEPDQGEFGEHLRKRLEFKMGEPFNPVMPGIDQFRIMRALQEKGYFSAEIDYSMTLLPTPAHQESDSLDLTFQIKPGPTARIGEIQLQGHGVPDELIRRELVVEVGETLKLGDLLESKQNLFDTGYFRSVDYRVEQMADPIADGIEELPHRLVWIFRERKMAALEGGVGVGTIDGLRLLGGWNHRNLFDRGQRLTLDAKVTLKDDSQGDFGFSYQLESIDYRFLYIVRLRASFNLLLFREKDYEQETRATSLETRAIRLSAGRRLDPFTVVKMREQFDFLYQRSISDEFTGDPNFLTRSLTLVLDRDKRNHYFSPSRGGQDLISYEVAGGIQGGDHHFHRLQLSHSEHDRIGESILATRLFMGGVWPYGDSKTTQLTGVPDDGIPYEERFYCGGSGTVRGYEDNSLGPRLDPDDPQGQASVLGQALPDYIRGGRYLLVANVELRRPFSLFGRRVFMGVLFLDGGNTWQSLDDISGSRAFPWQNGDSTDTRRVFYGWGLGFRYLTPLTVIRVDYGLPLQTLEDQGGRWHISLGHTF